MTTGSDDRDLIPSITFSDEERDSGAPNKAHIAEAAKLFTEHGFVRLENVYSPAFLQKLDTHYKKRYKNFLHSTNWRDRRPLFTVDVEGPFNDPAFYASPLVVPFMQHFLEKDYILAAMSSVASFPGAPDQHLHRDALPIFGKDYTFDVNVPPYSITTLIPLVDCTLETGCTKVWPGSHKCKNAEEADKISSIDPEVRTGSILVTDSRLVHRGGANHSDRMRPLLYMTFHRNWFRDFWGYENRPPVNISDSELKKVPDRYQHMFNWTKDRYKHIRAKNTLRRILPGTLREKLGK